MNRLTLCSIFIFLFLKLFSQGSGNVLSYNGTSYYVDLGSQVGDSCRTIEFWFKPTTSITSSNSVAIGVIIRDYNNGAFSTNNEYGFYFSPNWGPGLSGKLAFTRNTGPTPYTVYSNSNNWQANVWYHVAGVIDPVSGMKMYINGVLQSSTDPSTPPVPVQTGSPYDIVTIGTWGYWGAHSGNRFFNGEIDEVRFWKTARTQTEIRDNMCRTINPSQPNLRCYYRCDNNSTSILTDLTANSINGTLVNIPSTNWHYSSAPIGDTSTYVYPSSWTAVSLSLQYAPGDQFSISNVSTSPEGAHIYRVNSLPNMTAGLGVPQNNYYGIFITGTTATFNINYDFSSFTNYCGSSCTSYSTRNDNATTSWTTINPTFNNCALSKPNESSVGVSYRAEYILSTSATIPSNILGNDTSLCANGSINLDATLAGATYLWNNNSTNATLLASSSGIYWVDVTLNGCTKRDSISVNLLPAVNASLSSQVNPPCFGSNNGSATVQASGGTGIFSYQWLPSGGNTSTANNLPAGIYTCTITDNSGCSATQTVSITQPPQISIIASSTGETCFNGSTGTATANVSGGTGSFTYSWSPSGGNGATTYGVPAGNYVVTVTDANGCLQTQSVTITQPSQISANLSVSAANCTNDGSATANPTGGTGPYSYSWTSGGNAQTESNLFAGTYTVTITDANGCSQSQSFTVPQNGALNSSITSVNILCSGGNNGSATVSASGGNPPYSYLWAPSGGTNATATGLAAGTYTCTITDNSGCVTQQMAVVTEPPQITTSEIHSNILCNGNSTGTATVQVNGGTGTYSYSWAPSGGNLSTASGLSAGTYSVTITDSNGCTTITTVTLTQPQALSIIVTNDSICSGTSTVLSSSVTGGSSPYNYSWSSGSTISSAFVSPAQTTTYTLQITDANGCPDSAFTNVIVFPIPVAGFTSNTSNGYFNIGDNLPLCLSDQSSAGISIWSWDLDGIPSSQQSPCVNLTMADTGMFCVNLVVDNVHGCSDTASQCFRVENISYFIPNVFTPDNDGNNDIFFIKNEGMAKMSCHIYDRWGILVAEWDNPSGYWNGKSKNGKACSDGTYYYVASFIDFTGKDTVVKGFVELIRGK
jgi:gliding motility-associated-like protein